VTHSNGTVTWCIVR